VTLDQALRAREGKKLVFTNGVFDILHAGHVGYLREARDLGELLIVGVNSDESARKLGKGPDRPINPLEDRITVLEALRAVSGAVVFEEDTPEALIAKLKPEIHVKGGDYKADDLPETQLVRSYGGEVVILPFLAGRSTTQILKRLGEE
jgi:D-glycero-beta-D-manno-heptose 1-phosphate adenylyltransferase